MSKKVKVELVRGLAQTPRWMRTIVRTLGLRKTRDKVIHPDNGAIRGMVRKVTHLVTLTEVKE
ncbi:MAG: 50S ribosomal protein L30 [Deltaproteobacteria bacterium]|nr:50S ribosomal protein L30 [Deltaproteobacteria bacterium]MBI3293540.1 50S ribosomal protein L30 [Deltaproteobacteria bacterium]